MDNSFDQLNARFDAAMQALIQILREYNDYTTKVWNNPLAIFRMGTLRFEFADYVIIFQAKGYGGEPSTFAAPSSPTSHRLPDLEAENRDA